MLGLLCSSQTAEHEVSQAQVDVRAAAGKGGFVLTAEQSVTPRPSERAFHDPAVRENLEPLHVLTALHDLQIPAELLPRRFHQFASITPVGPDLFESRFTPCVFKHPLRSVAILNAGGRDRHRNQQPQCLDQNLSLASVHLLSGIVAAFAASLRGLRRLAIDNRRRGRWLPPRLFPHRQSPGVVQTLPSSVVPPADKVLEHRRFRRIIVRHPCMFEMGHQSGVC